MMKQLFVILVCTLISVQTIAQERFDRPPESGRAFALSMTDAGIALGELQQNFGGTIAIDYNPADAQRWARVDNYGILRFVDLGNSQIAEGVYTFPPFFDGFEAPSPQENKYFVRDVRWSPDGQMLAFYIENATVPDLDQGLWFWQPVRELSTDPAYQLLRPCPGYCSAAGLPVNDAGWQVLDFEWASDNRTLLVTLLSFENDGRRALTLRPAQRLDPPPATLAPTYLRYDYGHWSADGQQIIVSGNDPEQRVVFGTVDREGANADLTAASEIGMLWVQDAVQGADGQIYMLGSSQAADAPLQIVTQEGRQLTPPIGDAAPHSVHWSPDKRAVYLRIGAAVYVATVTGTVYDITALLADSPNLAWVNGTLPANVSAMSLPQPIAEGDYQAETTPEPTLRATATLASERRFAVGDLLQVTQATLTVYAEPIATADVIGTLSTGDELIITDAPLQAGARTWYRVQTLDYTGWINETRNLDYP